RRAPAAPPERVPNLRRVAHTPVRNSSVAVRHIGAAARRGHVGCAPPDPSFSPSQALTPQMKRIPPALSLVAAVLTAVAALLPGWQARADSAPWGSGLVAGSDWAGPYGNAGELHVYSNGDGKEDRDGPPGSPYECVELAQRWAAVRFGEQRMWPVAYAYQMWTAGPGLKIPFRQLPNGGSRPPQFGDLLVFDHTWFNPAGHVAVVAGTGPGFVDVVEQNWNNSTPTGRARLPIQGTTMPDRNGLPVIGWLRSSTELEGFWLLAGDGGIFPFGTAGGYGSPRHPPPQPPPRAQGAP